MNVPWAKLYMDEAEVAAVVNVIRSNWVSMGPVVKDFEALMAQVIGVRHAVAVNSGTAALDVALKCLGIGPEDEVIVPAFSYIATANAVRYQNATPIFADIDPETCNIHSADVARKISQRTRCVIAIDYGGQAADFGALRRLCVENRLHLVEDGAPGLGGTLNGKANCSHGDISITSFHTAKIFTTVEGGMVFSDSDRVAAVARMIRSQGEDPELKYHHPVIGHNYRMTELNAAIGKAQMARMADVLASRRDAAATYAALLKDHPGITLPRVRPEAENAWFLYPIQIDRRDTVKADMAENGIETNISWPMPIYRQAPYLRYGAGICPAAEQVSRRILCLPMYYGISMAEQAAVTDRLLAALDRCSRKDG